MVASPSPRSPFTPAAQNCRCLTPPHVDRHVDRHVDHWQHRNTSYPSVIGGSPDCEDRVSRIVLDAPAVALDAPCEVIQVLREKSMGPTFVRFGETTVARHVGVKNGCELAFEWGRSVRHDRYLEASRDSGIIVKIAD